MLRGKIARRGAVTQISNPHIFPLEVSEALRLAKVLDDINVSFHWSLLFALLFTLTCPQPILLNGWKSKISSMVT